MKRESAPLRKAQRISMRNWRERAKRSRLRRPSRRDSKQFFGRWKKPVPGQDKEIARRASSQTVKWFNSTRPLSRDWPTFGKQTSNLFPNTLKRLSCLSARRASANPTDSPQNDQSNPTAQANRTPGVRCLRWCGKGSRASLARERYRRQNDSGFSYQGGKKSFDTLVKEAEQELIKQKIDSTLDLQGLGR